MRILPISEIPHVLDDIKLLAKQHAKYLGFMPDGGFESYREKDHILVAADRGKELAGYVMYRRTRGWIPIAYLCVAPEYRGQHLGAELVEGLAERHPEDIGMFVKCRKDFPATKVWPKLLFSREGESVGRGADRATLIHWVRRIGETLFSIAASEALDAATSVVMDANIFFDLDRSDERAIPAKSLAADWLADLIQLYVTAELKNEIQRCGDTKAESLRRAAKFPEISVDMGRVADAVVFLGQIINPLKEREYSDVRQIAHAIGGDAEFFVTRDGGLLNISDKVEAQYGLKIATPAAVISRVHEQASVEEYRPDRFLGTDVELVRVRGEDLPEIGLALARTHDGESPRSVEQAIGQFAASPNRFDVRMVKKEKPLAVIVTESDGDRFSVPYVRVAHLPGASTWSMQLARAIIDEGVSSGASFIGVSQLGIRREMQRALVESGFRVRAGEFVRPMLVGTYSVTEALSRLREINDEIDIDAESVTSDARVASILERSIFPAKLENTPIQNFLVPIQQRWAMQIVDHRLSDEQLFGRDPQLAKNIEAVYYRRGKQPIIRPYSRILWYVSKDPKQIVGCSAVIEVVSASAKELFKRFKRLGVYQWPDVLSAARGDAEGIIHAIRFNNTELFSNPMSYNGIGSLWRTWRGTQFMLQAPIRLEEQEFMAIYKECAHGTP